MYEKKTYFPYKIILGYIILINIRNIYYFVTGTYTNKRNRG